MEYFPAPLENLVEQARGGTQQAFEALYQQTYRLVYFHAKSFTKNEEEALDLVQDAYLAAYNGLNRLQDSRNFRKWITRIVFNLGCKKLRGAHEVLLGEDGEEEFEALPEQDEARLPEESLDRKETVKIVKEVIEGLPVLQRAAVIAYYMDEMHRGYSPSGPVQRGNHQEPSELRQKGYEGADSPEGERNGLPSPCGYGPRYCAGPASDVYGNGGISGEDGVGVGTDLPSIFSRRGSFGFRSRQRSCRIGRCGDSGGSGSCRSERRPGNGPGGCCCQWQRRPVRICRSLSGSERRHGSS